MNKKVSLLILIGLLILLANPVLAQLNRPTSPVTIDKFLSNIESLVWLIFTAVVVVFFVVAGILFLTASGDAKKLETARSAFIWGIAGVVVGIVAFSIRMLLQNFLTT